MNTSCDCCVNISESIRIAVGTVGVASCSLSLVGCFCAMAIVVIYQKYVFSVQRVLLYLTASVTINTLGQLVERVIFLTDNTNGIACEVAGFIGQYASGGILISVVCIMLELLICVFYSNETGKKMAIAYLVSIFVIPLTVSWIPFQVKAFGFNSWECGIITHKYCKKFIPGIILDSFLWWIPLYLTLLNMIVGYIIITIKLIYDKKRYTAMIELDRNEVYQYTYDDIMYLRFFPIIYMIIDILPTASSLYDSIHHTPFQPLWIVSALIVGLEGGVLVLAAVIDPKTRKRLTYKQLKAAFLQNVLKRDIAEEYPIINGDVTDSLHPSFDETNHQKTFPQMII